MNKRSLLLTFLTFATVLLSKAQPLCEISPALAIPSGSLAGTYDVSVASWAGALTSVTDTLAIYNDNVANLAATPAYAATYSMYDACESPTINSVAGKIAVIVRGSCTFVSKAEKAQADGAIAVIIVNHTPGGGAVAMGGTAGTVTIPVISVSNESGAPIVDALIAGDVITGTMSADLDLAHDITMLPCHPNRWDDYATPIWNVTSTSDVLNLATLFYNNGLDTITSLNVSSKIEFTPVGGSTPTLLYSTPYAFTDAAGVPSDVESGTDLINASAMLTTNPATDKRGLYTVTHTVPADDNPNDNSASYTFEYTDDVWSKCSMDSAGKLAPTANSGFGAAGNSFGALYTCYKSTNAAGQPMAIKSVSFRCFASDSLNGKEMNVDIYSWNDIDTTNGVIQDELTPLYSTTYVYTDNDGAINRTVDLGADEVMLSNNTNYIVALTPNTANLYIYADNKVDFTAYTFGYGLANAQPLYDPASDTLGTGAWNVAVGNGLANKLQLGVSINPVLEASFSAGTPSATGAVVLTNTSNLTGTTTWTNNGVAVGSTSPLTVNLINGVNTICMTTTVGSQTDDTCVVINFVGINDVDFASEINLYPNPTNGKVTVQFGANANDKAELEVINVMGQTVVAPAVVSLSNNTYTMNLSTLANGVYYIKVTNDGKTAIKKVTIAR